MKPVQRVSFLWRSRGRLNTRDAAHEATRQGDDARIRVGLILEGSPQLLDPLVTAWVKQVRKTLKFPSEKMIYLVPDAMHTPGSKWTSPFSNDVEMISVESTGGHDGWYSVDYRFDQKQKAIGIWLMADGDNTHSEFDSWIRNLAIE